VREQWDETRFARGANSQRLNKPIKVAFSVLKFRLNLTIAAEVSGVTGSLSCDTANTVKI
jgi:hypothetical protein